MDIKPAGWRATLLSKFNRAGVANFVAAICVLGGLGYAIWYKNTDLVTFLAGAGIGYLLKDVQSEPA